jgi:hypothetical protein
MPLVGDGNGKAVSHSDLRAIGFWMSVQGQIPIQPVRVFVSYEALSQLDPASVRDLAGAFEIVHRFRLPIEIAASKKFDEVGFDAEKYEGLPTIRLIDVDLV